MVNLIDLMKIKSRNPDELQYDSMQVPPWNVYLTEYDVAQLHSLATSKKMSGRMSEKIRLIKNIMANRGFTRLAGGTNRIAFRHYEDPRIVCKVALDDVGMKDNPAEYNNQWYIRPFCAKTFSVSPCGTVAISERVLPFTSAEDFCSVAENIFDIIYIIILGKYIVEDIGVKYFMNWGIRIGFGPVLLDYPYIYELDGAKLFCDTVLPDGRHCGGEIDYDAGFNTLKCKRCGRTYLAREMQKHISNNTIIIDKGGKIPMNVRIRKGNEIVGQNYNCDYIVQPNRRRLEGIIGDGQMKVTIRKGDTIIGTSDGEPRFESDEEKKEREIEKIAERAHEEEQIKEKVEEEAKPEEETVKSEGIQEPSDTNAEHTVTLKIDDRIDTRDEASVSRTSAPIANVPNSNKQVIGSQQNGANKQVLGRKRIPMRSNFLDEGDY